MEREVVEKLFIDAKGLDSQRELSKVQEPMQDLQNGIQLVEVTQEVRNVEALQLLVNCVRIQIQRGGMFLGNEEFFQEGNGMLQVRVPVHGHGGQDSIDSQEEL